MKIALFGDRHISARSPRYEHALAMWDWAISDAIEQGATAFIGLGDVCEGDPSGTERMALGSRYQRMLTHGGTVAEVTGNHETRDALGWLTFLGVVVAWDQFLPIQGDAADVLLVPYARKGHAPYEDLGDGLSMADTSHAAAAKLGAAVSAAKRPHHPLIVAGHWTVAGTRTGDSDYEIHAATEMVVPVTALAAADLVVTGHIHRSQEVAPNIVVAGSLYRCAFGEAAEPKSYVLVTVSDNRVSWERRPVPARTMVVQTLDWPLTDGTRASLTHPASLGWLRGQEVKLTVRIPEDQLATFDPAAFDAVKAVAAHFVLDRQTIPIARTRAPEIATADTPDDQLAAWLRATEQPIGTLDYERLSAKLAQVTT